MEIPKVPTSTVKLQEVSRAYYTACIDDLANRDIICIQLCETLDRRVFEILWALFPKIIHCAKCKAKVERDDDQVLEKSEHQKLWWNFSKSCVLCHQCVQVDDVRAGIVMAFKAILNPGFRDCIEKALNRNEEVYDSIIDRYGFVITTDTYLAINGLRRTTTKRYEERNHRNRNRLYNAFMKFYKNPDSNFDDIERYRNKIIEDGAIFKAIDIAFSFGILSIPNFAPQFICNSCTN